MPQAPSDGVLQVAPEQQPFGHVVALQEPPEQTPPTQLVAQGGWLAQRHVPSFEQLSALVALQAKQTPPAVPHVANEGVLQVLEQQPLGHVVGVHAGVTQLPPAPHC